MFTQSRIVSSKSYNIRTFLSVPSAKRTFTMPIFATRLGRLSFGAPAPCFLWNFAVKLTTRKLVSWGYRRLHDRIA